MSQTATAAREPLLRIAKREGTTMPQKIAVRAIAILLALVVDALFIFFVTGLNPLSVYGVMWSGTFANMTRFSWMLRDLSTLLDVEVVRHMQKLFGLSLERREHCRVAVAKAAHTDTSEKVEILTTIVTDELHTVTFDKLYQRATKGMHNVMGFERLLSCK